MTTHEKYFVVVDPQYITQYSDIWKEKVSDQGPVRVRSEEKIPGGFISSRDINVWLPEFSLVP